MYDEFIVTSKTLDIIKHNLYNHNFFVLMNYFKQNRDLLLWNVQLEISDFGIVEYFGCESFSLFSLCLV